jgi:hypothetical protein
MIGAAIYDIRCMKFVDSARALYCVLYVQGFAAGIYLVKGGFFGFYLFYVQYSTLLPLSPLRFHCVGGCWDRTQDSCV